MSQRSTKVEPERQNTPKEILHQFFSKGLAEICDERFLSKRYSEFQKRNDPIYATLLNGMGDNELAKTFVSYWTIGQTLSVKSRFWLEAAIYEIIRRKVTTFGNNVSHAYSQKMLGNGYLKAGKPLAEIGEEDVEHLSDKSWEVLMKRTSLQTADLIIGEQERGRILRLQEHGPSQRRVWLQENNTEAINEDRKFLERIEQSIKEEAVETQKLHCNLLVVEPDRHDQKPHVTAFRFINPKTFASHDNRKQERVNLLRLYAYLCQEKIFRDPKSIRVYVAEIVPRDTGGFEYQDHYPDYFSVETYLPAAEFWKRLGVPFEDAKDAIGMASKEFKDRLVTGLRQLLPTDDVEPSRTLFE